MSRGIALPQRDVKNAARVMSRSVKQSISVRNKTVIRLMKVRRKMTYKEAYMKCCTLEDLKRTLKDDMLLAMIINADRKVAIEQAVTETLKEKGWEWNDSK